MQYLENENANLIVENEDLNTTLKINKDIIKSLLQDNKSFNQQLQYTFDQMAQETQFLESKIKQL